MASVGILIGLIGAASIAGALGFADACRSDACSTSRKPLSSLIVVAVLLGLVAYAWFNRHRGAGESMLNIAAIATPEEFDAKVLKSATPVFVDFFATWCDPCRRLEPTIAALEASYRGRVAFFRVDVDAASKIARDQGIEAMPTIIVFRDGSRATPPLVGVHAESDYRKALDKALEEQGK